MKLIGIMNELYNNNKFNNRKFKTQDNTICNDIDELLGYMCMKDDLYDVNDIIENLQSEIEIIEEQDEFVNIEEIDDEIISDIEHFEMAGKMNLLIKNQKLIIEKLKNE